MTLAESFPRRLRTGSPERPVGDLAKLATDIPATSALWTTANRAGKEMVLVHTPTDTCTQSVHLGRRTDPGTREIVPPIVTNAAFAYDDIDPRRAITQGADLVQALKEL